MNYHARIMNIPTSTEIERYGNLTRKPYKRGHRDARHAAAVLAIEADQQIEALRADLDRLHRERDSFQEQCRVMAEENGRVKSVLEGAYSLAIGWAGHYQFSHSLTKPHKEHQAILDACQKELGK